MRFNYGDEIDKKFVKVIVHEFSRAQLSFNLFVNSGLTNKQEFLNQLFSVDLFRYNAYALFVQHLYEYLLACFKRDRKNTVDILHNESDKLINFEVDKILRNWVNLIDHGYAPKWANHKSFYDVECPENFGNMFRQMRNSVSHADIRRIDGGDRITLTEFYLKYHKFAYLLYDNALYWWRINGDVDMGDVTSFNKEIDKRPM